MVTAAIDSEMARAFASPVQMEVNGRPVEIAPLAMVDWGTLEREALKSYQDGIIDTWRRNASALPAEIATQKIVDVIHETSRLTAADLPRQRIKVFKRDDDGKVVVEDGVPVEVERLVEYTMWWLTTLEGKRYSIYLAMRRARPNITLSDVDALFQGVGATAMREAANRVSEISEPTLKN